MPIGVRKQVLELKQRQIETVEAEAEIAQQRYVSELARIAKIADQKRIQKLQ